MKWFKKKETECEKCVVVERKLISMWDGLQPIILEMEARLKKLEAAKKPLPKKKRPQTMLKRKND